MGVKDLQDLKKISILRSQIDGKKLEDIMITDFPTVGPEDQVGQALSVMRDTGYQDVPVVENGNYLGMISYGTMLKKRSVKFDSKVKNLMQNMHKVSSDTDITELAEIMVQNNYRQLPVLNKHKKIVGILSRSGLIDIAAGIKAFNEIKVWEIMNSPVESVKGSALLDDAMEVMRGLDIRTVPVIDNSDRVVGIVGMKEIIDHNWKKQERISVGDLVANSKQSQIIVETVAATAPKTIDWNDDLGTAVRIMKENNISTLPVTEEDELIGIVTQYDIIELISACREREMLFIEISGLDEKDKMQSDLIYDNIKEEVERISKIYKPQSLIFHVAKYKEKGEKNKYSVSARMMIDGRVIAAKEVGWDLIRVSNDLMKKIASAVVNTKEERVTMRKKGK